MAEETKIDDELKRVVLARLQLFPKEARLNIGSAGEFNKQQLIENVEKETAVGEKIIAIQLNYLRALKEGIFYGEDIADNQT